MAADAPSSGPTSKESVFSLEDLDKIIEAEDPNFKNEMAAVKEAGAGIEANIESLAIEGEDGLDKDELEKENQSPLQKIMTRIKAPWLRLKSHLNLRWLAFKNRAKLFLSTSKAFLRHEFPERLKYYKAQSITGAKTAFMFVKAQIKRFQDLSRMEKWAFFFTMGAAIFSVLFLVKTFTGAWLPRFIDPLPRALHKEAAWYEGFKNRDELQELFSAFPEVEFHVLLNKVVVNLRPDSGSGRNPMGVFELYLGLDSQDTAIEVKDREREILDIVQRAIEKFSYSDVISQVGKIRIKSVVRDRVNEALNQGAVFHVYFNTVITTP